ncbi:MAG: signal peptide-domain containing protein [Planctomycetaceae bacterium]|nr:signal peptide-domain containing protein [Planctomycetaceae bacterium]
MAGNNIVTGAYGVKFKPNNKMELRVAYEIPYTARRDIIQNRLMVDLIIRY